MIDDLARRFTDRSLPKAEWTHAAHLAVGLWHVREFGAAEALLRLRKGIRELNESHGNANTADGGYHETITRAYVELLAQFASRFPYQTSEIQILPALLASPLADRKALLAFYSRDRLFSTAARLDWLPPDLSSLDLARLLSLLS
jgi:hypothetical protein